MSQNLQTLSPKSIDMNEEFKLTDEIEKVYSSGQKENKLETIKKLFKIVKRSKLP